ncbi:hypothetical protein B0F88_107103 [Methylobacter tundripaludum]|uniref:Uncharacterized protein n=1 Tax=Methylobacter tundripaludum TaxID=173365 RepID=A0A2S6H264_9GAMM|nr:hypothetical protein B0F88_107103 [Methylobacter tundripaludum]
MGAKNLTATDTMRMRRMMSLTSVYWSVNAYNTSLLIV